MGAVGTGATVDVVIVGGGIAGASLGTALAREGIGVVVLEATERFTDRVRGESMMPWGVAEAERLGVAEVLRDAGAHLAPTWKRYADGHAEAGEIPVGLLVPGVAGTLNLHHPTACRALVDAARAAGADVRRGVGNVRVSVGDSSTVEFDHGGQRCAISARLVVGADGRASVVRRGIGIELERNEATAAIVGLLVEGVGDPTDHDLVVEHERGMSLLFHQRGGRARAYHVVPVRDRARYAGAEGARRFVADLRDSRPELHEPLASAAPAGPCASFPNVETWTDRPARGSVVLIGDAAGQSDPTIGCGLSVAMRDARTVRDAILADASTSDAFASYGTERWELLRRLRLIAEVMVTSVVQPGDDRSARRARFREAMETMNPEVFPLVLAMFAGPETAPVELVDAGLPPCLRAA